MTYFNTLLNVSSNTKHIFGGVFLCLTLCTNIYSANIFHETEVGAVCMNAVEETPTDYASAEFILENINISFAPMGMAMMSCTSPVYDNNADFTFGENTSSTSESKTIPAGNDVLLLVAIEADPNGTERTINSVQFNGQNLTQHIAAMDLFDDEDFYFYYLTMGDLASDVTANVEVNLSGNISQIAVFHYSFNNVDQNSPLGTAVSSALNGTEISTDVTTTVGNIVIDLAGHNGDNEFAAEGANQTKLSGIDLGPGASTGAFRAITTMETATGTTTTMSNSIGAARDWGQIAVEVIGVGCGSVSVCQSNLVNGTQGNANDNFGTSVTMDACSNGNYFYSFEWQNSGTGFTNTVGDLKIYDGQTATGTPRYTQAITFSSASLAINKIILEGGTGTLEFTPGNQYTFMIDPPGVGSAVVLRFRYQNSDVYSGGQLLFNGSFNASQDIYFVVETTDENPLPEPAEALNFDGTDDYINLGDINALDGASEFTIESWVYFDAANGINGRLFGKILDGAHGIQYQFGGSQFTVQIEDGGAHRGEVAFTTTDTWVHTAAVYNGSGASNADRLKMYINGVEQSITFVGTIPAMTYNGTDPAIIGSSNGALAFFTGNADEFRIWSRALSTAEINANMNCELAGNEAGLEAYYKFNQGLAGEDNTGITSLLDETSNNHDGTFENMALNGATSNFVAPGPTLSGTCDPFIACDIDLTDVAFTKESCSGAGDGTITISATCTSCSSIEYSINGGSSFQASASFTGLSDDVYDVVVRDASDATCNDTGLATFGLTAYVPNETSSTVSVIDMETNAVIHTTSVSPTVDVLLPFAAAVSPSGNRVYFLGGSGNETLTVFNTGTNETITTVALGMSSKNLAISKDGAKVFVSGTNFSPSFAGVKVINTTTNAIDAEVSLTPVPDVFALSPDGNTLYTASNFSTEIKAFNTSTHSASTFVSGLAGNIQDLAVSPSGGYVYATTAGGDVSWIRVSDLDITHQANITLSGGAALADPNGPDIYVANQSSQSIDVITPPHEFNNVITNSGSNAQSRYLGLSPDDSKLFVTKSNSTEISVLNTSNNTFSGSTITVGSGNDRKGDFTGAISRYQRKEISVSGNGADIEHGIHDRSTFDHRYFNGSSSRTFTVHNYGLTTLNVSNISFPFGGNGFSYSGSTSFSVSPNGSQDITIDFAATGAGEGLTQVRISSDDCDEGNFEFFISACPASITSIDMTEACQGQNNGILTVNATCSNCSGSLEYSINGTTFQASNVFTGLAAGDYTVTVRDDGATTCEVTATATVTQSSSPDNTNPTAVCQDVTVTLGAGGTGTTTAAAVDNGSSDNCDANPTLSLSQTSFDCDDIGVGGQSNNFALDFVGDDDGVTDIPFMINPSVDDFSVEFWFNAPTLSGTQDLFTQKDDGGLGRTWFRLSDANLNTFLGGGGSASLVNPISANTWYHVAVTFDASTNTQKFYFDGALVLERVRANDNSVGEFTLANFKGNFSLDFDFNGLMDEVRIWNDVRTISEIQNNKDATMVGNEAGLLAYYPMEDGPGSSVLSDATGNGHNASLTNMNVNNVWVSGAPSVTVGSGTNTVTLTVTDAAGNTSTCTASVTVEDTTNPTITCPTTATGTTDNNLCTSSTVSLGTPTADDNCDGETVSNDAPATFPLGNTTVVWTVTDASNNTATCNQTVTVTDGQNPTAECQDVTVTLGADGTGTTTAAAVNNGSTDNCDANPSLSLNQTSFDCSNANLENSYALDFDGSGNINSSAQLNQNDNFTLECHAQYRSSAVFYRTVIGFGSHVEIKGLGTQIGYVVNNSSGTLVNPVTLVENQWYHFALVRRSGVWEFYIDGEFHALNQKSTPSTGGTVRIGGRPSTSQEKWNGALDEVRFWSVARTQAEIQSTMNSLLTGSEANLIAYYPMEDGPGSSIATDESGNGNNATFNNMDPANDWVSPAPGVTGNTVTLTVTDAAGNASTCTATVTVEDTTNPTITCPTAATGTTDNNLCTSSTVSLGTPTADDNCDGETVSNDAPANFPLGNTTVVWTVTDASNNTATCNQTVTVTDGQNPNAVCQAYTAQIDAGGNASVAAADINNNSSDNCGTANLSISAGTTAYTCADVGSDFTVTLSVDDGNGNTATCDATVTVADGSGNCAEGEALDCGGSSVVIIGDLNELDGISEMTLEAWINVNNLSTTDRIFSKIDATSTNQGWALQTGSSSTEGANDLRFVANNGSGQVSIQTSSDALDGIVGSWHHIAVVYSGSESVNADRVRFYVDGVEITSKSESGTLPSTTFASNSTDLSLSRRASTTGNKFDSKFDEVRIWTRALCEAEIVANKDCALVGNEDGLLAYYQFNQGIAGGNNSGLTTLEDATSNNYDGTLDGFALNGTSTNWIAPGASISGTCAFVDGTPPTASCQDFTAQIDGSGNASVSANDIDNNSSDACGSVSLSISAGTTAYTCADVGSDFTVTLTVTDDNSNTATCNATVTVADGSSNCNGAKALDFDGIDDYVNLGTDNIIGSSDFTIETWIYFRRADTREIFIAKESPGDANDQFRFMKESDNTLQFYIDDDGFSGSSQNATTTTTLSTNVWTHLAAVREGTNLKVYINGTLEAEHTNSTVHSMTGTYPLNIGSRNNAVDPTDALIDEVRIWDRALCQAEIQGQMNCELAGNETNLIAYYQFNQGFAGANNAGVTTLDDATSNNHDGTLTNFALDGSGSNWVAPGSGVTGSCSSVSCCDITITGVNITQHETCPSANDGQLTVTATCSTCTSIEYSVNGGAYQSSANFTGVSSGTVTVAVRDAGDHDCNDSDNSASVNEGSDTTDPIAECQDVTVTLGAGGTGTTTAAAVNNGSSDNCDGSPTLSLSQTSFDCDDLSPTRYSLDFDGSNDRVNLGDVNDVGTGDFTWEVWVKTTSTVTSQHLIAKRPGGQANGYEVRMRTGGIVSASSIDGNTNSDALSTTAINDGEWHHVAAVFDRSANISIYVDGVLEGFSDMTSESGNISNTSLLYFGARSTNSSYFDGQLAEIRFWTTARSTAEIQANMNSSLVGNEAGLNGYWNFSDGPGSSTLSDQVGTDNGTLTNMDAATDWLEDSPLGGVSVTLTVTDASTNSSTCTAIVTVEDNTNPTITCPADQAPEFDSSCEYDLLDYTGMATGVNDNCGSPTVTQSPVVGTTITEATTVTLTATDASNNTATCTFNVSPTTSVYTFHGNGGSNDDFYVAANWCPENVPTGVWTEDFIIAADCDLSGSTSFAAWFSGAVGTVNSGVTWDINTGGLVGPSTNGGTQTTLHNMGTINMSSGFGFYDGLIDNDNTIICSNGFNSVRGDIVNDGTFTFNSGSNLNVDQASVSQGPAEITNNGDWNMNGSGGASPINVAGAILTNSNGANWYLGSGRTLDFNAAATFNNAGDLVIDGTFELPATFTNTGVISGTGTLANIGGANTVPGTVRPGSSPGILNTTGDITFSGNIEIEIEGRGDQVCEGVAGVAGTAFDQIASTNNAAITVSGDVDFNFASQPTNGDVYTIFSTTGAMSFTGSITTSGAGSTGVTIVHQGNGLFEITGGGLPHDTTDPNAQCQAYTAQIDGGGNASVSAGDIDNNSSDNCGTISLSISAGNTSYTCADVGEDFVVTLLVDDGNGNTATCNATVSVADGSGNCAGAQALDFDGTDDYIEVPDHASLDFGPSDSYTLETWFYKDAENSATTATHFIHKGVPGNQNYILGLAGSNNSNVNKVFFTTGTTINYGTTIVSLDTWHHVAVTYDNGSYVLYLNGNVESSGTVTGGATDNAAMRIAWSAHGTDANRNRSIDGKLDEMRIWSRALCQLEIQGYMNCALQGNEADLVAYYNFDQGFDSANNAGENTLVDQTGVNNGTLVNFALDGASSNWVSPGASISGSCDAVACCDITVDAVAVTHEVCPDAGDGTITVTATCNSCANASDIRYSIDGSNFQTSNVFNNVADGTYTVTVRDVNDEDCNASDAGNVINAGTDTEDPTAECQNATVVLNASGNGSITAADINNGSSDNCDNDLTLLLDQTSFDCNDVGGVANNYSLDFAGTSDEHVVLPNTLDFHYTDFTVEGWFNASTDGGEYSIFSLYGAAGGAGVWIRTKSDGKLHILERSPPSPGGGRSVVSTSNVTDGNWHHFAFVRGSDNLMYLYINGTLESTSNGTVQDYGSTVAVEFYIGKFFPSIHRLFKGSIDEIRLWNVARTQAEIQANMNATLTGNETGLRAYYPMEDGPGSSTLSDATGNGYDGTLTNMDASTDWVNGALGLAGGGVEVTLTVTDNESNSSTCTATVTVQDNTAPSITCPGDQNVDLSADCDYDLLDYIGMATGVSDNCGTPAVTQSPASGTTITASQVVTLTATDVNGNSTDCTFNVNPSDNTNPTAECQDVTLTLDGAGNATLTEAQVNNGSSDNCSDAGALTLSLSQTAFDCDDIVSGSGNTALDFDGDDDDVNIGTLAALDNVGQFTVEYWINETSAGAQNSYHWAIGNTATNVVNFWRQTSHNRWGIQFHNGGTNGLVIINGSLPNAWTHFAIVFDGSQAEADRVKVYFDGVEQSTTITNMPTQTADLSGDFLIGISSHFNLSDYVHGTMDEFRIWSTARTQSQIQANMNSSLGAASGLLVNLPFEDGTGSSTASDASGNGQDGALNGFDPANDWVSGPPSVMASGQSVTLTVTDEANNSSTCEATITVQDTTNPTITCPGDVSANTDTDACTASGVDLSTPTTDDNCDGETASNDGLAAYPVGNTTVTWTVSDASENTATCTQIVTVSDNQNPTITCPGAVEVSADNNSCAATGVELGTATSSDNCPGESIADDAPASFPVGVTTVTYTVTDASSNTANCTQTVTVTDDQDPAISCPVNMTANTDPDECTANVTYTAPTGTDNCPGAVTTQVAGLGSGGDFEVGENTETYTVTDASGNQASCSFTITVSDNEDPTVTCRNIDAELTASDNVVINPADLVTTSGDNCTNVTLSIDGGSVTYECSDLGAMFTITVTATDDAGNTATCDAIVTVTDPNEHCCDISIDDNTVVVPSCPGNDDGSITVTASCSLCTSIEYSIDGGAFGSSNSFSGLAAGDYDIAVRDSGNHGCTTSQTVTVGAGVDTTDPVITCPDAQTVSADASCAGGVPDLTGLASATDNCSEAGNINITQDISAGTALTLNEATTVTLMATDEGTNTHTCDVLVTLIDDTAPDITCPADVPMNTGPDFCSASVFLTPPTATDNCSSTFTITANGGSVFIQNPFPGFYFGQFPVGTTTVTWTVTDENGQSTTCTNDVIITDDSAPTFTNCPANDLTGISDAENCGTNVTWSAIFFQDNCGTQTTLTFTHDSGDFFPVGTTTVTYTATDPSGNSTDCMFDVIVTDDTPPVVSCQDIEVFLDGDGAASIVVADVVTGVTDNCTVDIANVSLDISSFDCSQAGTAVTVTASVNDLNGVSGSCTAEVTVTDNTDPSAVCQDVTVSLDASGMGSVDATDLDDGSDDNCPNHTIAITDGQTSYDCTDAGQSYTLTLTVTDASNNTATCTSTVSVVDDTNPTITCPVDVSVGTDAGECTAVVTFTDPAGADNCSGHTVEQGEGMASGSAFPTGVNTVGYTVTDASGNTATCSFTITVSDDEDPAIADCPSDITQDNDEDACNAVVNWTAPTASDNCGVDSFTSTHDPGDTFDVGTATVTYTAMDEAGNSSTCSFTVTVNDTQAPEITCPADIAIGTDDNVCTAVVSYTAPVGTDNCAGQTTELVAGGADGSTFDLGETTVTYSVTDAAGNETSCSFTVTVSDDENPVITVCPDDATIDMDAGACEGTVTDLVAGSTATDNCTSSVTITQSPTAGSTFGAAHGDTQTVTITATDEAGNSSTCDVVLTLNDNQDPTITACPADIVQATDADVCTAVVNWTAPTGDDNCAGTVGSSHDSGDTFDLGSTEVTYSVTDAAGNQVSCSFNVTINDEQDPTITCPDDISVGTDDAVCTAVVTFTTPDGADNCSGHSVAQTAGDASGSAFALGETIVTFQVTDGSGNTADCSFTVTVSDDEAPSIAGCPANISQDNDAGNCSAAVSWTAPTAADNCGVDSFTSTSQIGDTFDVGDTDVTYTAVDEAGNETTCTFTITVVDAEDPQITCPANITQTNDAGVCGANITYTPPVGTDNCDGSVTSLDEGQDSGTVFAVGTTTVSYSVVDAAGNTADCSFTVTVTDDENPTIADCPENITQNNDIGICGAIVNWTAPTADDNCNVASFTSDHNIGDTFPVGDTEVTYTATDDAGNTAQCSFTITVVDAEAPQITCPANITQDNDTGVCTAVVNWTAPVGTDNCPGSVTELQTTDYPIGATFPLGSTDVTYSVADAAGNETSCTFSVTIVDAENPVAICQDITVELDAAGEGSIEASDVNNNSTDNCNIASMSVDPRIFDCSHVGANTVTLTVVDDAGNEHTCDATVTIEDNVAPIAICQDITIQLDEAGAVSIEAADVDNNSNDACGIDGLAIDISSFDCSNLGANTVTLTVTDNNSNESTCTSVVTVEDTVAPVINDCPENISVDAIATSCAASASWTEPTYSDNCVDYSVSLDTEGVPTIDLGTVVFGTFPGGETTISYTVTDPQGNESICSFTVTVVDNVGPVLTGCPDDIVVDNTSGECSGQAFWTAPIPSDNCTGFTLSASHNSGESFEVGSTTVTYTATDANDNESTCSFNVTVNDTEAPTVDCPETVEADAAGDCGYQIPDLSGLVTSSDNCAGDLTTTQSPDAGTSISSGTSVTVTVSDGTNSTDCSVSITVPEDLSLSTTSTDASCDDSSDGSATVTISGGTAPYTISWSSGGDSETESGLSVGDHTVDVTDANGCTASATVTIGSNDTTPPTLFCDDHTVSLDANGEASITINDVAIVMEDNCAIASMSISQDNFTCANIGANTVTVTVTDAAGLTSTCDATVTVEDNMVSTPPFCGSTIDLQLGSDGLVSIGAGNFDPVMDNCGTALDILILGQSTFTCGFSGLSLVVPVAVLDESENFSICTVTVNISDAIAPTAVCENTTVSLGSDGTASIGASDVDGGSDDNCGIESSIVTPSSFDCGDLGANTVTLVVTDEGGLTASCTATVTVVDDSAPTPLYCDDQVSLVLDASGSASLTTANFDSAVDNCTSSPTISILGQSSFDCSDAGTTVVVAVSATDAQSNVAQCNINVSVVDNTDPVALCQDASVVADGNGIATVDASAINNASFDNCSIASMTATPNTFSCSGDSDNVVTLTVTDPSGNTATCTATVTVTGGGGAGLEANCQDVTVSLDASGNASITAADVDNGSFGCGVSLSVSPSSFTCANAGNNQVTLTATESGGGTATCTAMVMVVDDINPVASCQDISVTLDAGTGMAVIVGGDVNDGSTDNCGVDVMNVSPSVFTCEDGGDNTVTLTVTDAAGNSSTCVARVSVGYAAPTAMCQASAVTVGLGTDGTATVDPAVIDNGSSGMCDDLTMSVLPATFDCADAGSNPITLIVTDGLGQTASCTATVNIIDNSIPMPDFCGGSVNIALDADGSVNIEESGFGTHLDNCGSTPLVIISLGQINFTCDDIGTNTDLLVAMIDGAGNLVTCFTDVVVTDPDGHCGSGLMVNEDLLNGVQTAKAEKPQIAVWQPELDENENSLELRGLTNTPNPFSYQTKISYRLTAPAEVQMWVMDESGRMVTTLTRGAKAAGEHNVFWQPGANVAHGVYFLMVRLDNGQIGHLKMHYTNN